MSEHFLEELGLTKGEIRVYLSLLSLGQTTSGPLIAESKISSSKVYEILNKLMEKGLVSHTIKNKTKYFQPTSPAKLKDYLAKRENTIAQQKKELEEQLPKLLARYAEIKATQSAEIFTGLPAIKTMLWELIAEASPGEQYYFFGGVGARYEEIAQKIFIPYDKYRYERKLNVHGIVHVKHKEFLKKIARATLRFVNYPIPSNIAIFRDKLVIQSYTENPMAILITSQEITSQFKEFFESVWQTAEK
ncbi:hypothetical protein HY489_06125 [Candidatus Woesearchaeota archaeon]|nr:hypothetical protein [Candidatus Woesearchaeota archaeon]